MAVMYSAKIYVAIMFFYLFNDTACWSDKMSSNSRTMSE
jgi:hypothetical protein